MFKLAEVACSKLTDLEREIIENIYLKEEQVTKLAKDLNYSRCHISRMKTVAVRKMRQEFAKLSGEEIDIDAAV